MCPQSYCMFLAVLGLGPSLLTPRSVELEQNPILLSSSLSLVPVILVSLPPRYAIDPLAPLHPFHACLG